MTVSDADLLHTYELARDCAKGFCTPEDAEHLGFAVTAALHRVDEMRVKEAVFAREFGRFGG